MHFNGLAASNRKGALHPFKKAITLHITETLLSRNKAGKLVKNRVIGRVIRRMWALSTSAFLSFLLLKSFLLKIVQVIRIQSMHKIMQTAL